MDSIWSSQTGFSFYLVNAGYRRRELEYLLRQSDASILFLADGAARPGEFIDILYELCPEMILGLSAGTRIVVLDRFRPAETLEALDTGRVSFISGSPTLFLALLQAMTDSKTDSDRVFVADGCGAQWQSFFYLEDGTAKFIFFPVEVYILAEVGMRWSRSKPNTAYWPHYHICCGR
jgi:hypothetical protein